MPWRRCRDIGGTKLGGILYSAHGKYSTMPSDRGRKNSVAAIARTADVAKEAGVDLVLEVVNRFETNLLEHDRSGPRLHQGDRLRSRHRSISTRFT